MNPEYSSPLHQALPSLPEYPLPPIPDMEDEAPIHTVEMERPLSTDSELLARLQRLEMTEKIVKNIETLPGGGDANPQNIMEKPLPPIPLFNNADDSLEMPPPPRPRTPPKPAPLSSVSSSPMLTSTPVHATTSPFMLNTPTFNATPSFRRSPSPPSRSERIGSIMLTTPTGQANGSFLTPAPAMVRAHSSPGIPSSPGSSPIPSLYAPRSNSPMRSSPKRVRSPFRNSIAGEEMLHSSIGGSVPLMLSPEISSISEDAELEIFPRAPPTGASGSSNGFILSSSATFPTSLSSSSSSSSLSNTYSSQTFPRQARRRPNSPLRSAISGGSSSASSSRASSVPASPHPHSTQVARAAQRFNETFVGDLPATPHSSLVRPSSSSSASFLANYNGGYNFPSFTSSSVPSTPTSARSRSPSISSLETIPDTPDAEVRAVEEDIRDREERKRLWDQLNGGTGSTGGSTLRTGAGFSRDKRKRWSVCGAEKRSDLNLETIWED